MRVCVRALTALLTASMLAGWAAAEPPSHDVLSLTLQRIDGAEQPLSAFRGDVLLLVNVASRCGFTPQYEGLEALHERFRARGFAVLGFPANDFANQEPGTNAEIAEFCRASYAVKFPMFAKIHVTGDAIHPLYGMLTSLPAPLGGPIRWNFQTFLVDRRGRVVARFDPATKPRDPAIVSQIEALLPKARP